jgi:hypothetical protein
VATTTFEYDCVNLGDIRIWRLHGCAHAADLVNTENANVESLNGSQHKSLAARRSYALLDAKIVLCLLASRTNAMRA